MDPPQDFQTVYIYAGVPCLSKKSNVNETYFLQISTIDEISNCSPGGQTLTKSVEFEEGTISTSTESHSHSVETGFEGENKLQ